MLADTVEQENSSQDSNGECNDATNCNDYYSTYAEGSLWN